MSFGQNLQLFRKNKGITQEELAERLEVSRQSVSKWESDASFPEMEKIIVLCDMFGCSMDTLVKGDAAKEICEDTAGYDRHMNRFAKMMSAGVGIIIFGVAVSAFFDAWEKFDGLSAMIFFLFLLVAVMLFVIGGMQNESFRKNNPRITDFYTDEQKKAYEAKFPILTAIGIGIIILGLVLTVGLEYLPESVLSTALADSSLLVCVAVGVSVLTYGGIIKDKYNIDKYNKETKVQENKEKNGDLTGKICGVIMLVCTIIAIIALFVFKWSYFWIIFAVGGLLCGIAAIIFGDRDKEK